MFDLIFGRRGGDAEVLYTGMALTSLQASLPEWESEYTRAPP